MTTENVQRGCCAKYRLLTIVIRLLEDILLSFGDGGHFQVCSVVGWLYKEDRYASIFSLIHRSLFSLLKPLPRVPTSQISGLSGA